MSEQPGNATAGAFPSAWNMDAGSGHSHVRGRMGPHFHGGFASRDQRVGIDPLRFPHHGARRVRRSRSGGRFNQPTTGWYAGVAVVLSGGSGLGILIWAILRAVG